jgi:hypothetical protein
VGRLFPRIKKSNVRITEADVITITKKWRAKLGISASQLPVAVMLTLVRIESSFRPGARNPGHFGLLQHKPSTLNLDSLWLYKTIGEEYWTFTGKNKQHGRPNKDKTVRSNVQVIDIMGGDRRGQQDFLRAAELSIALRMATWQLPHLVRTHRWNAGLLALYHHQGGASQKQFVAIENAFGGFHQGLAFFRQLVPAGITKVSVGAGNLPKAANDEVRDVFSKRRSQDVGKSDFVRKKVPVKIRGKVKRRTRSLFNPETELGKLGIEKLGANFFITAFPEMGLYVTRALATFNFYARKKLDGTDVSTNEQFVAHAGRGVTATETQARALSDSPSTGAEQAEVIFNNGQLAGASRAILSYYMTPEELRKGIIGEVYHLTDWHLTALAKDISFDSEEDKEESSQNDDPGPPKTASEAATNQSTPGQVAAGKVAATAQQDGDESKFTRDLSTAFSANKDLQAVNRYIISLVDAEFYRRRYRSRSVPAVPGPFNPFPVSGFPGLLLNPDRPILGYVSQISHRIDPQSATGSTVVSLSAPRYWDEGEVWYWFGGWNADEGVQTGEASVIVKDEDYTLYRRFPQWHNHYCVATNHYNTEQDFRKGENRRVTDLDRFYRFMLGCDSVDYMSNHFDKVGNPETLKDLIVGKDSSKASDVNFELSPATLSVLEKNRLIAEIDKETGEFADGTLARKFWGPVKPYQAIESNVRVEEAIDYNKRFGVRENELLSTFLENSWRKTAKGGKGRQRGVYVGPTFGNNTDNDGKVLLNPLQKQILTYMEDIEQREAGGGI